MQLDRFPIIEVDSARRLRAAANGFRPQARRPGPGRLDISRCLRTSGKQVCPRRYHLEDGSRLSAAVTGGASAVAAVPDNHGRSTIRTWFICHFRNYTHLILQNKGIPGRLRADRPSHIAPLWRDVRCPICKSLMRRHLPQSGGWSNLGFQKLEVSRELRHERR